MEIGEAGFGIGALADVGFGFSGGERVDDGLVLGPEGPIARGAVERAVAVDDPTHRGEIVMEEVIDHPAAALDVGIEAIGEGPGGVALDFVADIERGDRAEDLLQAGAIGSILLAFTKMR